MSPSFSLSCTSAVLNLKFLNELAGSNDRNFKFTALVINRGELAAVRIREKLQHICIRWNQMSSWPSLARPSMPWQHIKTWMRGTSPRMTV